MAFIDKYIILSGLFDYPDHRTSQVCRETSVILAGSYPDALQTFCSFEQEFLTMNQYQREEYFINTFEVDAVTSMDLGYILFGEDYKRGNFLAMMQQEQNLAENDLGSELADHLPNVLRLLPLMADQEVAAELAFSIVIPAVKEMLRKFENSGNIYQLAFETLVATMRTDFAGLPYEAYQVKPGTTECAGKEYACGADFLNEIGKQKF